MQSVLLLASVPEWARLLLPVVGPLLLFLFYFFNWFIFFFFLV